MASVQLPANGFLSYVRADDALTGKRISRLCGLIQGQLQLQLGRNVDIFQDTAKIAHGTAWERQTSDAIDQANFFIPVVTPAYLRSKWCAKELALFKERERRLFDAHPNLARTSRIFPIHLIEVDAADADEEGMFDQLRQLQFFEFREFVFADYDTPAVRNEVTRFVNAIRDLLKMSIEAPKAPPPAPPAPLPPPPAPAPAARVRPSPSAQAPNRVLQALSGAAVIEPLVSDIERPGRRTALRVFLYYLMFLAWAVVLVVISSLLGFTRFPPF